MGKSDLLACHAWGRRERLDKLVKHVGKKEKKFGVARGRVRCRHGLVSWRWCACCGKKLMQLACLGAVGNVKKRGVPCIGVGLGEVLGFASGIMKMHDVHAWEKGRGMVVGC